MKTVFSALLATAVIASPIAATAAEAAPQRHTVTTIQERGNGRTVVRQQTTIRQGNVQRQQPRYAQPARYGQQVRYAQAQNRQWHRGERFDRNHARNYRVMNDYRAYSLQAPPRGYQWVRSNNDAVLVALASGLIGAVIGNAIR